MSDTKQAKALLNFGNHSLWKLGTLVWFVHTVISEHIMFCTQLTLFFHWQVCNLWTCSIRCGERCSKLHRHTPWTRHGDAGNEFSPSDHSGTKPGHQKHRRITYYTRFQEWQWRTESSFDITRAICYNTAVPEIWSFRSSNRRTKDNRQTTKRWSKYYSYQICCKLTKLGIL